MYVGLGYAIGVGVGLVLGIIWMAIFGAGNAFGATGFVALILIGGIAGIAIAIRLTRTTYVAPKRIDYYTGRVRQNPNAAENWPLLDYWELVYRNIDGRLVPRSVERVNPQFVKVTARFAGAPVTLTHSVSHRDGEYVIATRWDDLADPGLRRELSRAWWRSRWWE